MIQKVSQYGFMLRLWENKPLTLISLCSRNCKITFLKYSRLTSSSFAVDGDGDPTLGDPFRDGTDEDTGEAGRGLSTGGSARGELQ